MHQRQVFAALTEANVLLMTFVRCDGRLRHVKVTVQVAARHQEARRQRARRLAWHRDEDTMLVCVAYDKL